MRSTRLRARGRIAAPLLLGAALFLSACGSGTSVDEAVGSPTPAHTAGVKCMPRPSACGFPDATNTGVSRGASLRPFNGVKHLDRPGEVLENTLVTGAISVEAPNVVIRNVKLVMTDPGYGIQAFGWRHNVSGLQIDHVEIDLNGFTDAKGIAFDGYTARHVWFHNGLDCAHAGNKVTITDSFCDLPKLPRGSSSHADGFQSDGGGNLTFRHNTILNPNDQTSAILLSTNTDPISNVVIDDNLMAGGGYTVYCGTDEGGVAQNTVYTNNVISRVFFRKGGYWGPTTWCNRVASAKGNRWDNGSYKPGGQGGGGGATKPRARPRGHLTKSRARKAAKRALARKLGHRFTRRAVGRHIACHRRSRAVVACKVKWRTRHHHRVTARYSGKVVVSRLSSKRRRYELRVRAWSRACHCKRTFRGHGVLR